MHNTTITPCRMDEKWIRLNVGEWVRWGQVPHTGRASVSPMRAQIGQDWHAQIRKQTQEQSTNARFEEPIEGIIRHGDWTIELKGRIDQIVGAPHNEIQLQEIKSITDPLPEAEQEVLARYPQYRLQLATYMVLYSKNADSSIAVSGQLIFVNIADGFVQRVNITLEEAHKRVQAHLSEVAGILESIHARQNQFRSSTLPDPFPSWREGQYEALEHIEKAWDNHQHLCVEAPTGYGKTAIALHAALRKIHEGLAKRILFLSGKTSGQWQALEQLKNWRLHECGLQFLQIRNQADHEIDSFPIAEADKMLVEQRMRESATQIDRFYEEGHFSLNTARQLGYEIGVPPYYLTMAALPHAEIWIADYNYLFAPAVQHILHDVANYRSEETIAIIDEAHLLPNRVAEAYSASLRIEHVIQGIREMQEAGISSKTIKHFYTLEEFIQRLPICEEHAGVVEYDLETLLEDILLSWQHESLPVDSNTEAVFALLREVRSGLMLIQNDHLSQLLYTPQKGMLKIYCMDPSFGISQTISPLKRTCLMSATLFPIDALRRTCGLPESDCESLEFMANWQQNAYHFAVDFRPDTRYRQRKQHYVLTSETIAQCAEYWSPPFAVFFSSYQYAQEIKEHVSGMLPPYCSIAIQSRKSSPQEEQEFIQNALEAPAILFLVLGGRFAESIDSLGGRLSGAVVVGPALPEVNAIQNKKMQWSIEHSREAAFEEHYIIPAMRKIRQAIGRLVRSPGQHVPVLLHGKRFGQPEYQKHLRLSTSPQEISSSKILLQWLTSCKDYSNYK